VKGYMSNPYGCFIFIAAFIFLYGSSEGLQATYFLTPAICIFSSFVVQPPFRQTLASNLKLPS